MSVNIIKVGGSILAPNVENIFEFAKAIELVKTLKPFTEDGDKFIIPMGGGNLARKINGIMKKYNLSEIEQHNAGIAVINLNAVLLRACFGNLASEKIIRYEDFESESKIDFESPIIIAAAGKPGHSSDYDAVLLAKRSGAKRIVSLKNVEGVYTADPKKNPNVKILENLTWSEYLNVIGNPTEFAPGDHFPVDYKASNLARELKIEFDIMGSDFNNLTNFLQGKKFLGTVIKD